MTMSSTQSHFFLTSILLSATIISIKGFFFFNLSVLNVITNQTHLNDKTTGFVNLIENVKMTENLCHFYGRVWISSVWLWTKTTTITKLSIN